MASFKKPITAIRIRGTLVFSLIMLLLSALYCLGSLSFSYVGAYLVTASFFKAFDFTMHVISSLLFIVVIIWIGLCILLTIINRKYWWAILTCLILTPVFWFIGTMIGAIGLQFKNAYSITYSNHSYHLNHIYDYDDRIGHYDLLECDLIELNCKQLFRSPSIYPKIDTNARISVDKITEEITVTVDDKLIFQQPLE